MAKVSIRGGFSDRNGIKPINTAIQLYDFDERTRIQLRNMISKLYQFVYGDDLYYERECIQSFLIFVVDKVYSQPIDIRRQYDDNKVINMINDTIIKEDYDEVLTLIEAIIQYWDKYLRNSLGYQYYDKYNNKYVSQSIYGIVNEYFSKEYIGYRFINGEIVPISDECEMNSLTEALRVVHKPVYIHLSKATRMLSDRDNPDYENCIKESISAIEAMCEIIVGKKGNLGDLLKQLTASGVDIHPALRSAFSTLYGYTSDANGIRHAGDIGGKSSTFEEAKFMLVACSAFVNYLVAMSAD